MLPMFLFNEKNFHAITASFLIVADDSSTAIRDNFRTAQFQIKLGYKCFFIHFDSLNGWGLMFRLLPYKYNFKT